MRDQWLKLRPAIRTKRINKYFTIPAFSASCGPKSQYGTFNFNFTGTVYFNSLISTTTAFTVELWFKPQGTFNVAQYLIRNTDQFDLYIDTDNKIVGKVYKAATGYTVKSKSTVANNNWTHVAFVYDGTNSLIYLNGLLSKTGASIGQPLDASTFFMLVGQSAGLTNLFQGNIAELRVWTVARTADQIKGAYQSPRDRTGAIDTGLNTYITFRDLQPGITQPNPYDVIRNLPLSAYLGYPYVGTTYGPPLKYGASFIAKRFTVTSTDIGSIVFPVSAPDDVDHCCCISWLDEDGTTTIRRKLYLAHEDTGVEDIAPNPPAYSGEVLPVTYYIEFWNVDGQPTVNLNSALTILSSITTVPQYGTDHTNILDNTPVGTSALAASYPITFPLTFAVQQTYP